MRALAVGVGIGWGTERGIWVFFLPWCLSVGREKGRGV
jgi:hypothetical protein